MRQLLFILTVLFLTQGCADNQVNQETKTADSLQTISNIKFPIKAKSKSPDRHVEDEDTLIATLDKIDFFISPKGKLYWGQNPGDTLQLLTDLIIEHAYLFKTANILYVFYTETDHEGATSRLEKIDLNLKKDIWHAEIQGFNLGYPYFKDNFVYVTTIGVVGKLDLDNGSYAYQFFDLYDGDKYSFNSFDTIIFKDSLTIYLSYNRNQKRIDSLIVNEKTGGRTIKK